MSERPPSFRFGPFVLDLARRQLTREGVLVPLRQKDLEILALLLTNADRAVAKEEILKQIWPETVVDENNLPRHISTLRKVLGETPGAASYIETVPGWGYRMTCPVERVGELDTTATVLPSAEPPPVEPDAEIVASSTEPEPFQPARRTAVALAGVLFVVAGVTAWYVSSHQAGQSAPARALRQVTYQAGHQEGPAWSPDGRSLALTSDQAGNLDVYVQTLASQETFRVTSSIDHDWQPSWAPDGRQLAFRSERDGGGIYVVNTDGTGERRLADFGYEPRWSPDGSEILISTGLAGQGETSRLFLVGSRDGNVTPFSPDRLAGFQVIAANWYPGGRRLSVSATHPKQGRTFVTVELSTGTVAVSSVADDVKKRIEALGLALRRFVWAPSGRFLYFEGTAENIGSVWRIEVDPNTQAWISGPERLTTGAGQDTGISLAPDGTKLAFGIVSARKQLWALPFDPKLGVLRGEGHPFELAADEPINASIDAQGQTLVYRTVRAGRAEIRERSISQGRERVLQSGVTANPPHMSRDGKRLAYTRTASSDGNAGSIAVFLLSTADATERQIARLNGTMRWTITDWAPDNSALIGTCAVMAPGALSRLCLMPLSPAPTDGDLQLIAEHPTQNLFVPRFSPDKKWISFIASNAGRSIVYIMPSGGGPWIQLTDNRFQNDKLRWAPDSRAVYFVSNRTAFLNVWKRQIDVTGQPAGPLTQVTFFNSTKRMIPSSLAGTELAVTSDTLVLPLTEASSRIWMLEDVDK